jgi:signal transduction histidine kinase
MCAATGAGPKLTPFPPPAKALPLPRLVAPQTPAYPRVVGSDGDSAASDRLASLGEAGIEIAHELRNALQIISASAYLARLELSKGDAAAAVPHVAKIERNARTAHGILDDLLALARDEALPCAPVLLSEAAAAARAELPADCAQWEDAFDPLETRVRGHAGLLVRLLHILYENAVQVSSPRPPHITTRARAVGERIVIDVADDGPGVSDDVGERAFDRFVTGRAGGTGLGLPLARRIAEAHGGSIALAETSAAGATFRLELPR